jgi:hypothetical protein
MSFSSSLHKASGVYWKLYSDFGFQVVGFYSFHFLIYLLKKFAQGSDGVDFGLRDSMMTLNS